MIPSQPYSMKTNVTAQNISEVPSERGIYSVSDSIPALGQRAQLVPKRNEFSAPFGWLLFLVFLTAFSFAVPLAAQTGTKGEYEIKAEYLSRFYKYIDWPAEARSERGETVTIGILGENPFGDVFAALNDKIVKGKRLVVKQLASLQDAERCQIVFISASEKNNLSQILDRLKQLSVLTVGEVEGFARSGGMINLVPDRNKVRLEINPDAAERARLTINPKLLEVAKVVKS